QIVPPSSPAQMTRTEPCTPVKGPGPLSVAIHAHPIPCPAAWPGTAASARAQTHKITTQLPVCRCESCDDKASPSENVVMIAVPHKPTIILTNHPISWRQPAGAVDQEVSTALTCYEAPLLTVLHPFKFAVPEHQ